MINNICEYYKRYGTCKFNEFCRYEHKEKVYNKINKKCKFGNRCIRNYCMFLHEQDLYSKTNFNFKNKKCEKIQHIINYNKNIDDYNLEGIDCLAIKATMGLGKTRSLIKLSKQYKKIIFVTFRVTLINELGNLFYDFIKYSDVNDKIINTDEHNKIITTIDSLHRIRGDCDLVVIDEYSYTLTHLVEYVKEREQSYSSLCQYIGNSTTKVIILDALMELDDIKFLTFFKKNIKYIEYKHSIHEDKKIFNFNNNIGSFIKKINDDIDNNKKIVICSNSKSHMLFLQDLLQKKYKNKTISCTTSDNSEYFIIDEWDKADIIIYTPSITAGISYEKIRYHSIYGFFINISAPVEMSIQQLFRVRNLTDKNINICTMYMGKTNYDTDLENIKSMILQRDHCVVDGLNGIKINCIKNEIIEDEFFYLFTLIKRKTFLSRNDYNNRLINILKDQGITNIENVICKDTDLIGYSDFNTEYKNNKFKRIQDAINIDYIEAEEIKNSKSKIDKEQLYKLQKYNIIETYGIDNPSWETIKKVNRKKNIFNNIIENYCYKDRYIDHINTKLNDMYKDKYEQNNIKRLYYGKKYERLYLLNLYIKELGFNSIFDEDSKLYNEKKVIDFYNKYKKEFILLFDLELDNTAIFKEIFNNINKKINIVYGIRIKATTKKFKLIGLDFWEKNNINYKNEKLLNKIIEKEENIKENKEMDALLEKILNGNLDSDNESECSILDSDNE